MTRVFVPSIGTAMRTAVEKLRPSPSRRQSSRTARRYSEQTTMAGCYGKVDRCPLPFREQWSFSGFGKRDAPGTTKGIFEYLKSGAGDGSRTLDLRLMNCTRPVPAHAVVPDDVLFGALGRRPIVPGVLFHPASFCQVCRQFCRHLSGTASGTTGARQQAPLWPSSRVW